MNGNTEILEKKVDNKEDRIYYLDKLRILAAFLVVGIHVTSMFFYDYAVSTTEWLASTYLNSLCHIAVPIFLFIGGALHLRNEKNYTIKQSIYKAFTFVVIFFIWFIIYNLIDIIRYGGGGVLTNYKYHLWYLPAYAVIMMLLPVLKLICKKENKDIVKYLLIIFFVFSCCFSVIKFFVLDFNINNIFVKILQKVIMFIDNIKIDIIVNIGILFISGWYFSTFDFKKYLKFAKIIIVLMFILPIFFLLYCLAKNSKSAISIYTDSYTLFTYLTTISVFIIFRYSPFLNKPNKFLDFIGKRTFGVYLVHVFYIELLFRHYGYIFNDICSINVAGFFFLIALTLCIFIISLITSLLLYFIPKKIRRWIC